MLVTKNNYIHVQGFIQSGKVQDENKKQFLLKQHIPVRVCLCVLLCFLMRNRKAVITGEFFWSTLTCNSVQEKA